MEWSSGKYVAGLSRVGRLPTGLSGGLAGLFVHGDLEGLQEAVVLGGELDLPRSLEAAFPLGIAARLVFRGALPVVALIETNGGFQHQEDVVPGALDFANGFGNPVGF